MVLLLLLSSAPPNRAPPWPPFRIMEEQGNKALLIEKSNGKRDTVSFVKCAENLIKFSEKSYKEYSRLVADELKRYVCACVK